MDSKRREAFALELMTASEIREHNAEVLAELYRRDLALKALHELSRRKEEPLK